MVTKKIFLASSSEFKVDWEQFETFINRKNKEWVQKVSFLSSRDILPGQRARRADRGSPSVSPRSRRNAL